nr:probable LRR receptor-like serine/threonine-protein kinase At3g47570 [Tanacetum cinerariifolium]
MLCLIQGANATVVAEGFKGTDSGADVANLVQWVLICGVDFQGNEFKAIVNEFMPNESLARWLHNVDNEFPQLTLFQRVCIALDVANALDYLHHHARKTIIHCDLKPSNILLMTIWLHILVGRAFC